LEPVFVGVTINDFADFLHQYLYIHCVESFL
jgi:hypothetical protein